MAAKSGFLDGEVVERALIDEEDFGVEEMAAHRLMLAGEKCGEVEATYSSFDQGKRTLLNPRQRMRRAMA